MAGVKLSRGQRKRLYSVLGGSAFFAAGVVLHLLSLSLASSLCFLAAGIVAGIMCVTRAVRGIFTGNFLMKTL